MDRFDFYFDQEVTEGELDGAFDAAERADRAIINDAGLIGVCAGLSVVQNAPTANLSVQVDVGTAYDPSGRRIRVPSVQTVSLAADSGNVSTAVVNSGNEKIVGLYLRFKRLNSDARTDGNGNPIQFSQAESFEFVVAQGAEAVTPTPPADPVDTVRLAYITRTFGQTQILNADIDNTVQKRAVEATAGALSIAALTIPDAFDALITLLDDHINGTVGVHPASSIAYAGGATWADSTTNPAATVEAQFDKIINDLRATTTGNSGAHKLGVAARTAWLDTTANPVGTLYSAIEKIITDLNATAGAARIGAAATSQSPTSLASGSVRSQLDALLTAVNARARIASNETITGQYTFNNIVTLNAQVVQSFTEIPDVNGLVNTQGSMYRCATPTNPRSHTLRETGGQFAAEGHRFWVYRGSAGAHPIEFVRESAVGTFFTLSAGTSCGAMLEMRGGILRLVTYSPGVTPGPTAL